MKDRPIIVDLCCGPGATIRKILAHSPEVIYAIDSNERYISLLQHLINQQPESKTSVIPMLGDANTLPISNSTTDYVICRVALQYLDVERVLGEVYRILNKDGKFFALVHGSGYILDYIFNRRMIFNKQTVQFCDHLLQKKRSIERSGFLKVQRLIKSMEEAGFSNIKIIKDSSLIFLGLFPVYFAIVGEKKI